VKLHVVDGKVKLHIVDGKVKLHIVDGKVKLNFTECANILFLFNFSYNNKTVGPRVSVW